LLQRQRVSPFVCVCVCVCVCALACHVCVRTHTHTHTHKHTHTHMTRAQSCFLNLNRLPLHPETDVHRRTMLPTHASTPTPSVTTEWDPSPVCVPPGMPVTRQRDKFVRNVRTTRTKTLKARVHARHARPSRARGQAVLKSLTARVTRGIMGPGADPALLELDKVPN